MNLNFTPEAASQLQKGIELSLSRWTALRMAVENGWGGSDTLQKMQQFGQQLFHRLTQSREQVYIDDVEDMLDEFMDSLSAVIEDGSIEEIAENLMVMREECLQGNFERINRLKETKAPTVAYTRQPGNDDDDDDSSEDDDDDDDNMEDDKPCEMEVDATESQSSIKQTNTRASETSLNEAAEEGDGWTVVSSRRNKGRRN